MQTTYTTITVHISTMLFLSTNVLLFCFDQTPIKICNHNQIFCPARILWFNRARYVAGNRLNIVLTARLQARQLAVFGLIGGRTIVTPHTRILLAHGATGTGFLRFL